jgi:TolA-binding protein
MKTKTVIMLCLLFLLAGCGSTKTINQVKEKENKTASSDSAYMESKTVKTVEEKNDSSTITTDSEITITYGVVTNKDSTKAALPVKEVRKTKTIEKRAVITRNKKEVVKLDTGYIKKLEQVEKILSKKDKEVKRAGFFNPKNISIAAVLILLIAAGVLFVKYRL